MDEWFQEIISNETLNFDLVIYLRSRSSISLKRILRRDRAGESDFSLENLKQIHDLHEKWLSNWQSQSIPILIIDANQSKKKMKEEVLRVKHMFHTILSNK